MKLFPDSILPLQARTLAERYVIYQLETSAAFPRWSLLWPVLAGAMWLLTGSAWLVFLAAPWVIEISSWWQARILVRLIQRATTQAGAHAT